ncbi:hypothetical protein BCV71DRAFT_269465 [Rhizopus microsporus]|uniref:Uncharacterized protein n=1 Tax=Rhizopus microsporus TaxID=58291 RepID=A0A1X0RJG2_RHIZD|nr:hypothetical protein BCV71DRAFT_269465 [Rhizopus microsporus]
MLETIEQSTLVYEKFDTLPTILIISNKSSSRLKSDGKFSAIDNSFLIQCESKFWANECFLFIRDDLVNVNMVNTPTSVLFTLCQSLADPNKSFTLSHDLDIHTICLACETTTDK